MFEKGKGISTVFYLHSMRPSDQSGKGSRLMRLVDSLKNIERVLHIQCLLGQGVVGWREGRGISFPKSGNSQGANQFTLQELNALH